MVRRTGESGNIFFTLFGAVAMVGLIGVATSALLRGPVGTVVAINQKSKADSQIQIASRLALLEAAQDPTDDGDCDSDGFIEPLPWRDAGAGEAPTNGGWIPMSIGASKIDPWGTDYGYCVWDNGALNQNGHANCDNVDGAGSNSRRLDGGNRTDYPVMVIISAGPDRTFQVECNDWVDGDFDGAPDNDNPGTAGAIVYNPQPNDDIIISYTYDEAIGASQGLWQLMSGDPGILETDKGIDVGGNANFKSTAQFAGNTSFGGFADFGGAGTGLNLGLDAKLDLSSGGLLSLPTDSSLTLCNSANYGLLRLNVTKIAGAQIMEVCQDSGGTDEWVEVGSNGTSAVSELNELDDAQKNGSSLFMGTDDASMAFTSGGAAGNTGIGVGTLAGLTTGANNVALGAGAGATITNENNNILIGQGVDIPAPGTSDYLNIGGIFYTSNSGADVNIAGNTYVAGALDATGNGTIGGTLGVTGATTLSNTLGVTGATTLGNTLTVAGDINDSNGDVIINDGLTVTGAGDFDTTLNVDGNLTAQSDLIVNGTTADINANLDVSGTSHFVGAGDFDTTLNVDGNTDLESLDVTNGSTFGGLADFAVHIQLGDNGATTEGANCAGSEGEFQYDFALDALMVCTGGQWQLVATGGSSGGGSFIGGFWKEVPAEDGRIYYSSNFVGVGENNPQERLHVSNGGLMVAGTHGGVATVPVTGAGTRMFFHDNKSSFRAGAVTGTQWDTANVGDYSFGAGYDVTASGASSVALGQEATAAAANSMAIGLGDSAGGVPQVSGVQSLGIFMGAHPGINMSAANTMGLFGGRMVIDPNVPATKLSVSTGDEQLELDVEGQIGAIKYCDENGNNCFDALSVAIGSAPGNDREILFNSGGVMATDLGFVYTSAGRFGVGTSAPEALIDFSGTGAMLLPRGDTAQRPAGVNGMLRYNSANDRFEGYQGGGWQDVLTDAAIAAGNQGEIQFNSGGAMGASNAFFWDLAKSGLSLGSSTVSNALTLDVTGDIGAQQYCDDNGANCFLASDVASGTITAPGADTQIIFNSGGELGAHANFTFNDATNVLAVTGTLNLTSAATLGDTLSVTGATTLSSTLGVTGATSLSSTLNVDGDISDSNSDVTINDGLNVTGAGDFDSTLNVDGNVTVPSSGVAIGSATLSTGGEQDLELDVTGDIGGTNYCDDAGNNCFTAADIASGSTGAPGNNREMIFNNNGLLGTNPNFVFGSAGQLGIGLAVPDDELDVVGTAQITGNTVLGGTLSLTSAATLGDTLDVTGVSTFNDTVQFTSGSGAAPSMTFSVDPNTGFYMPAADQLGVSINGAERIRITPNGAIVIGDTTASSGEQTLELDINGDIGGANYCDENGSNCFTAANVVSGELGAPGLNREILFNSNGQLWTDTSFVFGSGGDLGIGTNNPQAFVDFNSTEAILMPRGLTGQRPGGINGMFRYNTTKDRFEGFQNGNWRDVLTDAAISAGNDRQIQFNSNGEMGADANFVFDSAGRLGIGTGTPGQTLDVAGTVNATGAVTFGDTLSLTSAATLGDVLSVTGATTLSSTLGVTGVATFSEDVRLKDGLATDPSLTFTNDQNTGVFSAAADEMGFTVGGAEAFRVDSSGNLLVGTTSVSGTLLADVEGDLGAVQYCDENGNNCFTAASVSSGSAPAPGNNREIVYNSNGVLSADPNLVFGSGGELGIGVAVPDDELDVAGTAQITGNTVIGGTLDVAGATQIDDTFDVINGNATTLSGTLGVTGAATLSDTLSVTSAGTFGNTLGVTGATTLSSTLDVTGATSLSSTLNVDGDITDSNSDVTINDGLSVTGNVTVPTSGVAIGSATLSTGGEQDLELDVTGDIGGTNYCDDAGNNCFTAADVASGALGAPGNDTEIIFNSGNQLWTNANFVLDSAGRLGIGLANPDDKLDVVGTAQITGNTVIGGTLDVAGATQIDNTFDVINGNATTLSGTLNLTSAATFGYTLSIAGEISDPDSDLQINDGLNVTGNVTVPTSGIAIGSATLSTGGEQDLELDVTGDIGGTNYCDADGNNCFTATDVASGALGAPGLNREMIFNSGGKLWTDTNLVFGSSGWLGLGIAVPQAELDIAGTGAVLVPRGTTAQQPASPVNGMFRYNSDKDRFEGRQGGAWRDVLTDGAISAGAQGEIQFNSGGEMGASNVFFWDLAKSGLALGSSTVTGTLTLDVTGDVGAQQYCDDTGANCFLASDVFAGTITAPGVDTQIIFNSGGEMGSHANFTFNDATNVLTLVGNASIDGTLSDPNSSLQINDDLNVTGTADFDSTLNVDSNVTVPTGGIAIGSATLSTGGEQNLELDVTGDVGATNYCDDIGNDCFTAADFASLASGSVPAPGSNRQITFNSNGSFWAATNFVFGSAGQLGIGLTNPDDELDVVGTAQITGNTVLGGTLNLTSSAIFGDTLDVTGATTLSSTLDVSGVTQIDNNFNVLNGYATSLSGTLGVTGAATFGNTVYLSAGSAAVPSMTFTGDGNTGIYHPAADELGISTGGTEKIRITAAGALVIGDTSASTGGEQDLEFDVAGDIGGTNYCDADGNNCFTAGDVASGALGAPGLNRELLFNNAGVIGTNANFVFGSGGELGIGLNNPDDELDVVGTAQITGNTVLGGTLNLASAGTFGYTLDVTGATTLSSTLNVTGATSLSGTLNVDGDISDSNSDVTINDGLSVTGNVTVPTSGIAIGSATLSTGGEQDLELDVTGDIGGTNYCDADGNNCFTAGDVASGVIGAPGLNREMIFNSGGKLWTDTNFVFGSSGWFGLGIAVPQAELDIAGTGSVLMPRGTTAQRPAGINGMFRYNADDNRFEGYQGGNWRQVLTNAAIAAGAQGQVQFASGGEMGASANFFWDTAKDGLALGSSTVTGTLKLDVTGDVGATNYCDDLGADCFTAGDIASLAAGSVPAPGNNRQITFNSNGSFWADANFVFGSAGQLGIGLTNPDDALDVVGTAQITGNTVIGGTLNLTSSAIFGDTLDVTGATTLSSTLDVSGVTQIDNNFNVLNGYATSLSGTLGVTGAATFGNTVYLSAGSAAVPSMTFSSDGNTGLYNPAADQIGISTGGTEKIRITAAGALVIGDTSASTGGEQDLEFDVAGDIGGTNYCDTDGNNCFTAADVAGGNIGAPGNDTEIVFNSGNQLWTNANFVLDSAGRLGVGTSIPTGIVTAFSDTEDVYFTASDITVSQEKRNPPALVLRGKYDGGPGGSITPANYDVTLENFVDTNVGGNEIGRFYVNMNGTEALSVYASNNSVGIGTGATTPTVPFQVAGTDAIQIPAGTTGQQPGGAAGMLRFNTTLGRFEGHNGSLWGNLAGDLTDLDNVTVTGPVDGEVLYYSGTGWVNASLPSSSVNAAGADRQIQFNSGNAFAADTNFVYTSTGDFVVGSYQTADTGNAAEDKRMFFDKSKGAFRAGTATGTEWDDTNVGSYSAALGGGPAGGAVASGDYSMAFGGNVTASGIYSTAMGAIATATNNTSVAIGGQVNSTGIRSVAIGSEVEAAGTASMALGLADIPSTSYAKVSGNNSLGIFMGGHENVDFAANRTMGLFGGRMVIDPRDPATNLAADTAFEVEGTIKMAYGGEACDASREGAIHYDSATDRFKVCQTAGAWEDIATGNADPAGSDRQIQFNSGNTFAADANFVYTSAGDFVVGSYQLDDTGNAAEDKRMFFDKSTGAFRAGVATGVEWDAGNIGDGSVAMGQDSQASGWMSVALGYKNTASGSNSSVAIGRDNTASGTGAVALGFNTNAGGDYSLAAGYKSGAAGNNSIAIGSEADANANYSMAIGLGAPLGAYPKVTGVSSIGIFMDDQAGYDLTAANTMGLIGIADLVLDADGSTPASKGCLRFNDTSDKLEYSHDCTSYTELGAAANAAGNDRQIQFNSGNAMAADANFVYTSTGDFIVGSYQTGDTGSAAEDSRMFFDKSNSSFRAGSADSNQWDYTSSGQYSTALGYNTTASGISSTAMGSGATASGDGSLATGQGTTASGTNSLATGYYTTANDFADIAMGYRTSASGGSSVAMGQEVKATALNTFAISLSDQHNIDTNQPQVSGSGSLGVFMDKVDNYDLSATDTFGIIGGELMIDGDGNATAGEGCLRFNDTSDKLEYSHDCTSYTELGAAANAAGNDRQIQFNSGNAMAADANFVYTSAGDFIVGSYQTADTGNAAEESRMFFDKSKSAFRAGHAWTTQWDDANVGSYSTAMGDNAIASGDYSTAFGSNVTASGDYSVALGRVATASGFGGFAFGVHNGLVGGATAGGYGSIAMGLQSSTTGLHAVALGPYTTANGDSSRAIGLYASAGGFGSTAMGHDVAVSGDMSFAYGAGDSSGVNPVVSGNSSFGIFMGDQVGYDLSSANTMGLIGIADLVLDADGSTPASKGCLRFNDTTDKLEYSHDCSTYSQLGAAANAAGSDRQIQFNSGNAMAADANFVYTSAGDFIVGSYQTADTGNAAEDNRIFFDKSKGAFRAGGTDAAHWDDANVGGYSAAFGWQTKASGSRSFAANWGSQVSGNYSAGFNSSNVSGAYSFGAGSNTTVSGNYAFAAGESSEATGDGAAAFGRSYARGSRSFTAGSNTHASGLYSVALGMDVKAGDGTGGSGFGDNSMALGLGDALGVIPQITGDSSFGIFMGDQSGVDLASANTMGLFGGRMVIDPSVPATNLTADTALDVSGAIKFSSAGGTACDVAREGAIQYGSGGAKIFEVCADTANGWEQLALGGTVAGALNDLSDVTLTGPATGDVLYYSGSEWINASLPSSSVAAAGADRQIQFNSGGAFMAHNNFVYTATGRLGLGTPSPSTRLEVGGEAKVVSEGPAAAVPLWVTKQYTTAQVDVLVLESIDASGYGDNGDSADILFKLEGGGAAVQRDAGRMGFVWDDASSYDSYFRIETGSNDVLTEVLRLTSAGYLGIGTSAPQAELDVFGTGALIVPRGTTAERPASAVDGMLRYNSASDKFEGYQGGSWQDIITAGVNAAAPDRGIQFNSGNAFAADANFVYTSTGYLGLGISTPQAELDVFGTGALIVPRGTTAERPASAVDGMLRYNSASDKFEGYQGGSWQDIVTGAAGGSASAPDRGVQFNSGGSFSADASFTYNSLGNLGVGISTPQVRVDVGGSLRIADGGETCSGVIDGALRYRSGIGVEYCDGVAWQTIAATGAGVVLNINPTNKLDMDVTGPGNPATGTNVVFSIANTGDQTSNALSYTLSNTTNFTVTSDTCSGNTLAASASCQIEITPQATADGTFSGSLKIDQHNQPEATLQGIGSAFGCYAGQVAYGGTVVQCDYAGAGNHLIVNDKGCDGTTTNPTCSGSDTFTRQWSPDTSTSYGSLVRYSADGDQNHVNLLAFGRPGGTFPAAEYCDALDDNGQTDWFLPTDSELQTAVLNIGSEFSSASYHTSRESQADDDYIIDGGTGNGTCCSSNGFKNDWLRVRCMRIENVALPAAQADTDPDNLTFVTKFATSAGTPTTSDTLTVTGITQNVAISIAGDASAQYSINGGAYTSAAGTVSWDDTVTLRLTSPAPNTRVQADLTIGTDTFNFSVVTEGDCGGGGCAGIDKRVFVTSGLADAQAMGGISGVDAYCQGQAGGLGGTWKAIVSGSSHADWAANRIDYNWDRLVNMNGGVIATSAADLWDGTIGAAIDYDSSGTLLSGVLVSSGTNADGTTASTSSTSPLHCLNWNGPDNTGAARAGSSGNVNGWIDGTSKGQCRTASHKFYCMEVNAPTVNLVLTPATSSGMDVTGPGNPSYGAAVTFTVENQGTGTSAVMTASLANSSNFEILNDNCTGNTLASLATCTYDVRPKASADGDYNTTTTISDGTASDSSGISGTASGFANATALWLRGANDDIYYNSGTNPQVGIGTSTPQAELDVFGTGALITPRGTTAERPGTVVPGMIRYNSTSGTFEGYESGGWTDMTGGAGGGSFTDLSDTPANYTGNASNFIRVNTGETGLEFTDQIVDVVTGEPAPTDRNLNSLSDVVAAAPSTNDVLTWNGANWVNQAGGGGTPAGADRQIQFNSGGAFGAATNLVYSSVGYVGIGNAVPSTELEVTGTAKANKFRLAMVTGAADPVVGNTAAGAVGEIQFNSGGALGSNGSFIWDVSAGKLGIGTSAPDDGKVEVKGGTVCVDTDNDGFATSCISSESDIRLKKNVQPITGALDKIHQLKGVSYDWRWNEFDHIKRYEAKPHAIGVIAQDVEKVFPEAMGEDIDGYKTVEYRYLVAPMVEAIKELDDKQNAQVAALRAENEQLKAQLASLEADRTEMHAMVNEVMQDVKGLKAHTGYGVSKAEIGLWFIAGMGSMALLVFFFGGGVLRNRKNHQTD